jgi:hypothetical protein
MPVITPYGTNAQNNTSTSYDSAVSRVVTSGLPVGGAWSTATTVLNAAFQTASSAGTYLDNDWRVRISLAPATNVFYKDPSNQIMSPLKDTDGVIFPYTPSITVTHQAIYESQSLTHSNYTPQFFKNSDVADIVINGEFTVQNQIEGQYLLAAIYFLRSASKMFFGDNAKNQSYSGNPPPLVFLDGYGSHYFPHVTCVLSAFSHTLPPDVDYISVNNAGTSLLPTYTRLPTSSTVSVTLRPVYSRKNLHENFGLSDFAAGRLLGSLTSGGFL